MTEIWTGSIDMVTPLPAMMPMEPVQDADFSEQTRADAGVDHRRAR